MLKITRHVNAAGETPVLVLQGRVVGRWVAELRSAYAEARQPDAAVTVDLRDVTFIDAAGIAFFTEMGAHMTLINCSLFAAEQLKEVLERQPMVQP